MKSQSRQQRNGKREGGGEGERSGWRNSEKAKSSKVKQSKTKRWD